jgi:hypothetical protein
MPDEQAVKRALTAVAVDLPRELEAILCQSFSHGNVNLVTVPVGEADKGKLGSAQACFLLLNQRSVRTATTSKWFARRRTMLYGLGKQDDVMRFAQLGINAWVDFTDELSVRAAVDTTRNLLSRAFDECSRVPIVVPVRVQTESGTVKGISRNLGYGGMAVRLQRPCSLPAAGMLEFQLPGAATATLPASPRWYSGSLVGFQFCPPEQSDLIKKWVRQYSYLAKPDAPLRGTPGQLS